MTEEDKPQNNPLLKIIVFLETFLITNGSCCKRFSYEKPFFFQLNLSVAYIELTYISSS